MENRMKCIVIDDEPIAVKILEDYIEKVPFLRRKASFRSAVKALEYLRHQSVDLIFLDIKMPDLSGIQFLRSTAKQPLVVFTTAHSEYAVESYDYQVVDYLLKPIEFDRFLKAAIKAQDQYRLLRTQGSYPSPTSIEVRPQAPEAILIKSGTEYHPLKLDDILYIEGAGNYVLFVMQAKKVMALMNLKDVTRQLPADRFFRIHKSYIVNFHHIDVIETEQVRIGKTTLPIGESFKGAFLEKIKSQSS
jgi:two-component system LytT family response regulator